MVKESKQLAQEKIEARERLLAMSPLEAQKLVEQTLYPQYWQVRREDNIWQESPSSILPAYPLSFPTSPEKWESEPTMEKLTPETLREIFLALQSAGLEAVVVGGQAINLWAYQYYERLPELQAFLPFASEDLDFYGGKVEAIICSETLQGKVVLNKDFDPSPNAGVVIVNRFSRNLRIDFLASVYGLNDAEINETAITFIGQENLAGVQLKVLHPVLCLEGKLRSLRRLPQQGRQDLKHVQMSLIFLREFLKDLIINNDPRLGLNLVERVLDSALREDGLSVWYRHNLCIESAIPLDIMQDLNNDKWQKFCLIRLPQLREQIRIKREHYRTILERIELSY
jgi:hypothetical protein